MSNALNKNDYKKLSKLIDFLIENDFDLSLKIEQNDKTLKLNKIEIEFLKSNSYVDPLTEEFFYKEAYNLTKKCFLTMKLISKKFEYKLI